MNYCFVYQQDGIHLRPREQRLWLGETIPSLQADSRHQGGKIQGGKIQGGKTQDGKTQGMCENSVMGMIGG